MINNRSKYSIYFIFVIFGWFGLPAGMAAGQPFIVDVSPTVSFVNAGQPFNISVRVVSGPPNMNVATIWLSLQFNPAVCHAYPDIYQHSPGNYIPSPSIIQLATAGGDYGVMDGKFDYEIFGLGAGSSAPTGTISRNPMTAVGWAPVSSLVPKVVRMWNSQGTPIPASPTILSGTVYINPAETPTPTPTYDGTPTETPTPAPTPTETPTPEPTIDMSSAPLAPDIGSTLMRGFIPSVSESESADYLELWNWANEMPERGDPCRLNGD